MEDSSTSNTLETFTYARSVLDYTTTTEHSTVPAKTTIHSLSEKTTTADSVIFVNDTGKVNRNKTCHSTIADFDDTEITQNEKNTHGQSQWDD